MVLNLSGGLFGQEDVRETPASTSTSSVTVGGASPVGAIIAWIGTPALPDTTWVECNGQVLDDSESVFDTQTIPDLNGDNRFLRGNATAQTTGGAATHDHQSPIHTSSGGINTPDSSNPHGSSGSFASSQHVDTTAHTQANFVYSKTSDASSEPAYYNIKWIMRVK